MRGDGLRCRRGDEVIAVSTASSGARSVLLRGKEICVLPSYLLKVTFDLGQGLIYCPVGLLVAWYPHKFEEIPGS